MEVRKLKALVIGPGKAFGDSLIGKFLQENFTVYTTYARPSSPCSHMDKYVQSDHMDLGDPLSVYRGIQDIPPMDLIIYNAKMDIHSNPMFVDRGDFSETLAVQVEGALQVCQLASERMRRDHPKGLMPTVILTGGGFKDCPEPEHMPLSVGKAALHSLFLCLRPHMVYRGVALKTLVIDGKVGLEPGEILPGKVAQAFWNLYTSKTTDILSLRT